MEEDEEIRKKEQEIIELVEKEEKSKDSDYSSQTTLSPVDNKCGILEGYDTLSSDKYSYYNPVSTRNSIKNTSISHLIFFL